MRISIPGLGGRLRRARNETGLSQEAVAERIGISWMTVHRWERSQRAIPDHLLDRVAELYNKPVRWFMTLEEGDLAVEEMVEKAQNDGATEEPRSADERISIAEKASRKIKQASLITARMAGKVVDTITDLAPS